jgi:hypothetical protein
MNPGWFGDPWRVATWRWYDGYQWSPYTWPANGVTPLALAEARRKEASLRKWAKVGLTSMLVGAAVEWVSTFSAAHALRSAFDRFGQTVNGNAYTVQGATVSTGWADILLIGSAGIGVVFLVWQYSAATVARGLGYPARVSPGRGVGSWFLPIGNFWLPYQAMSDLLPPDHPMRPLCLRAWLAWTGAALVNFVAFFLALAWTAASVVAMTFSSLLIVYAFVTGIRLVDAVFRDHTYRLTLTPGQ